MPNVAILVKLAADSKVNFELTKNIDSSKRAKGNFHYLSVFFLHALFKYANTLRLLTLI